jgi:hypothetical protein
MTGKHVPSIKNDLESDYCAMKHKAQEIIRAFYIQHGGFKEDIGKKQAQIRTSLQDTPYRFEYVIRKYFMNVTFDYRHFPWKYVLPVFSFYLQKKLKRHYAKLVKVHLQETLERLRGLSASGHIIIRNEDDISQLAKIILACMLSRYIQLYPIFGRLKKRQMRNAYLSGYYLGLAYLISDHGLDHPQMDAESRHALHDAILKALVHEPIEEPEFAVIEKLRKDAHTELPASEFPNHYAILYHLQRAQFDDAQFTFNRFDDEEVIEKLTLLALKTHLSLFAIQMRYDEMNLIDSLNDHLLYSLLVQLDDDMRDVQKDQSENIRTFFTQPWTESDFNPHALYLKLVERMCSINPKLKWLYMDYFAHQEKKTQRLDEEKINTFLEKLTGIQGRDLLMQLTEH